MNFFPLSEVVMRTSSLRRRWKRIIIICFSFTAIIIISNSSSRCSLVISSDFLLNRHIPPIKLIDQITKVISWFKLCFNFFLVFLFGQSLLVMTICLSMAWNIFALVSDGSFLISAHSSLKSGFPLLVMNLIGYLFCLVLFKIFISLANAIFCHGLCIIPLR